MVLYQCRADASFLSIMIGVTLGAGSGDGWTTLLIVIIFHQIFEGMA